MRRTPTSTPSTATLGGEHPSTIDHEHPLRRSMQRGVVAEGRARRGAGHRRRSDRQRRPPPPQREARGAATWSSSPADQSTVAPVMERPTEGAAETFGRGLAAERLQSTHQINAFRLQGVTAILTLLLLFRLTVAGWVPPPLGLLVAYWAAAGIVWWASRQSDRLARLAGLSIPFVDMPLAFLLLRGAIA